MRKVRAADQADRADAVRAGAVLQPPAEHAKQSPATGHSLGSIPASREAVVQLATSKTAKKAAKKKKGARRGTAKNTAGKSDHWRVERYGAGQSEKLFYMDRKAQPGTKGNKMQRLFPPGSRGLRGPRSFKMDRTKQILRHLSTHLLDTHGGVEVQTYYDHKSKRITLSSNEDKVNAALAAHIASGGLRKSLAGQAGKKGGRANRVGRHRNKLRRAMRDEKWANSRGVSDIRTAILKDAIDVTGALPQAKGLHAERRLQRRLKRKMGDRKLGVLAGTKRPCMHCAADLDLPGPGPAWTSRAATQGVSPAAIRSYLGRTREVTHVTDVGGTPTADHDSDSDSDDEA